MKLIVPECNAFTEHSYTRELAQLISDLWDDNHSDVGDFINKFDAFKL